MLHETWATEQYVHTVENKLNINVNQNLNDKFCLYACEVGTVLVHVLCMCIATVTRRCLLISPQSHARRILRFPGFVQNLKILESPWIWKQKFKASKVFEFIKKCLKVDIFWNCLALRIEHFVNWFSSYVLQRPTKLFENWNSLK
jgi:flagellar biosynthesis protein FlhB